MRKTKLRKSNGITLIALVITIIVLLILAGVAIAMLSGQNGILNKAKEAKEKTEEGQKQEETALTDYEIDMNFIANNSKYKCRYGMITGFSLDSEGKVIDTVGNLKDALPQNQGYEIYSEDGQTGLGVSELIKTGMQIKKNKELVAWTVIYGDTTADGIIDGRDLAIVNQIMHGNNNYKDYIVMSADTNNDGVINAKDGEIFSSQENINNISQDRYVSRIETLLSETDENLTKKYVELCNTRLKGSNYSIEWDNENECYVLQGVNSATTVSNITQALGSDPNIKISEEQEEDGIKARSATYLHTDGREIDLFAIFFK